MEESDRTRRSSRSGVAPSDRARVRRIPQRARYEADVVHAILDDGLVAHVAFARDGQPFVLPMVYGRVGEALYLHGAPASRLLRNLAEGVEVSVAVTHVDALVLARSAFHHSVNYRSVVLFGRAVAVTDEREKQAALRAIVEQAVPGRWDEARVPDDRELRGTSVLRLPIGEASAKVRTGPPVDDAADLALDCWAGVIPLRVERGAPEPAPDLKPEVAVPRSVRAWTGRRTAPA